MLGAQGGIGGCTGVRMVLVGVLGEALGAGEDFTRAVWADMQIDFLADLHVGTVDGLAVGCYDVVEEGFAAGDTVVFARRML